MRLIKREDLAKKYATHDERIKAESQYEIYPALEAWSADKTKEQVASILSKEGINNQPVWNSKEVSSQGALPCPWGVGVARRSVLR